MSMNTGFHDREFTSTSSLSETGHEQFCIAFDRVQTYESRLSPNKHCQRLRSEVCLDNDTCCAVRVHEVGLVVTCGSSVVSR